MAEVRFTPEWRRLRAVSVRQENLVQRNEEARDDTHDDARGQNNWSNAALSGFANQYEVNANTQNANATTSAVRALDVAVRITATAEG